MYLDVLIQRGFLPLLFCLVAWPAAAQPLLLDDAFGELDAWPVVTVLVDSTRAMRLEQALARRADFAPPRVVHANFGVRDDVLWLSVPVQVPEGASGRWVLSVDYATLDRIDLYVLAAGEPIRHVEMGRLLPFAQRPLPSHLHAVRLDLSPGHRHELLLRVETKGSTIVPLTLLTPAAFHTREVRTQMLQGVVSGIALCLLLYSLAQWAGLRDRMFLHYAVVMFGTIVFFLAYYGFGPQHLWPGSAWLTANVGPLSVLVGLFGAFLFVERALDVARTHARTARVLQGGALLAVAAALASAVGLIDFRATQLIGTLLGPLPMLLAIPVAFARAREGDRVAGYMMAGWAIYAVATLVLVGLVRGLLPFNLGTQHAFQLGSMFEMLIWVRVLGVRIENLRASAQRAHLERDALRSLAHTDALTGLPNRRGLSEVLQRSLLRVTAQRMTAVFLLDLDGFKPINDRLGHEAGDEVLVGVARRLESLLRGSDTVARLGGDEFVVVASGLAAEADARALGRKLLDGFREPFVAAGQPCLVGLTIGYALAPLDGQDASSLLKRADAAMYAGKQAGRHCVTRGQASVGLAGA